MIPIQLSRYLLVSLFQKLDRKKTGAIHIKDFLMILREAGLIDPEGQNFASLMLDLIDIDRSTTIDESEFVAFAVLGASIDTIRHKLLKFFAFVDEDGNGRVDFDEINHALEYLCQKPLTEEECERMLKLAEYDDDGIDVIELLNVVTVAKVQALIEAYHYGSNSIHPSRGASSTSKDDAGSNV